jgi:hypothetical protein
MLPGVPGTKWDANDLSLKKGRVLINPFCKRSWLNVRFAPKAIELLRRREMSRRAKTRHAKQSAAVRYDKPRSQWERGQRVRQDGQVV